jgi:hypothetical protein
MISPLDLFLTWSLFRANRERQDLPRPCDEVIRPAFRYRSFKPGPVLEGAAPQLISLVPDVHASRLDP